MFRVFIFKDFVSFYRDTTCYTFHKKGDDCAGGKRSKERITLGLCASLEGEKITPLVIGKSRKPRCFINVNPDSLPVMYRNNAKAWMTGALYEEWLRTLDRKMKRQKRKILLFVDNAPSHPKLDLPNVKVQFFPPNVTSVLQPMDQGIIQTLKLKFRKRQLQHFIREVDNSTKTGTEILKDISLLDAIYWINGSWAEVQTSTIVKCFAKSGFSTCTDEIGDSTRTDEIGNSTRTDEIGDDVDDDVPLRCVQLARDLFGCEFSDLHTIDERFKTCNEEMTDWNKPASEILGEIREDADSDLHEQSDDDIEDGDVCASQSMISLAEFQSYLIKMKQFAINQGKTTLLNGLMDIDNIIGKEIMESSRKQTSIRDFFN